ncbi:putative tetratricopeptide repeat family protein [alpha proteobacterium U9-1i]|nr:putative tetratricopeptide repeat family protein [alpha proteobacterium U9-1i]
MLARRSDILKPALIALALWAQPASAEPPGAAVRLYTQGQFLAAAERAEAQTSPSSLAFAARALMAACITEPDAANLNAWLNRAERAAREALQLDTNSVEARLQWALVLGVRGRRAGLTEAVSRNYAPRGRRLIEQAIALEPNNAWAHALMGGWHLEVLRRGGRTGARLYGARLTTGLAEFERARDLAPDDAMIMVQYAIALIELDANLYGDRARALLAEAENAPARDAFEAHTLSAARDVASAYDAHGGRAAQAAARAAFL